jgi:hypothetical protein
MVHYVLFEIGEQMSKPRGLRIQARDLFWKMFDYWKWRRHTVGECTEMPVGSTARQRAADVDWKWDECTVINNATIVQMCRYNY